MQTISYMAAIAISVVAMITVTQNSKSVIDKAPVKTLQIYRTAYRLAVPATLILLAWISVAAYRAIPETVTGISYLAYLPWGPVAIGVSILTTGELINYRAGRKLQEVQS